MRITRSHIVERKVDAEAQALRLVHLDDPEAFANDPRVIAYLAIAALGRLLATFPRLLSYPYRSPGGHAFRYADTYGWRLIFEIRDTIHMVELVRVGDFRSVDP